MSKKREFRDDLITGVNGMSDAISDLSSVQVDAMKDFGVNLSTSNTHLCNTIEELNKTMKGIHMQLKRIADGLVSLPPEGGKETK